MSKKLLLLLTATLFLSGCTKKENKKVENENPVFTPRFQVTKTNDSVENDTDKPKEPSTNGLQIPDSKYEEIIKKSLVTKGNNYLVKQVLSKMRAGEEVIVSTIGGSVTEGAGPSDFHQGYAYQFKDLFIEKYDNIYVQFIIQWNNKNRKRRQKGIFIIPPVKLFEAGGVRPDGLL